jgi:MFS family permease
MTGVSGYIIGLVLSLQTLCTCIIFTLSQYIYAFYLQSYPSSLHGFQNVTNTSTALSSSGNEPKSVLPVDPTAQAWAQQRSADLFFWINVWSFCPIIVMTYVLGLYTPALGRRLVLILPMLGTAIQLIIWLSIIYAGLPEYWWYIAAFVVGLSGSDNIRSKDHVP